MTVLILKYFFGRNEQKMSIFIEALFEMEWSHHGVALLDNFKSC
jgi:hypothetical protein